MGGRDSRDFRFAGQDVDASPHAVATTRRRELRSHDANGNARQTATSSLAAQPAHCYSSDMTSSTVDSEIRARIAEVLALLDAMPETSRTRELRTYAKTYRWALDSWARANVPLGQWLALREFVDELHTTVRQEGIPDSSVARRPPLSTPTAWASQLPKRRG